MDEVGTTTHKKGVVQWLCLPSSGKEGFADKEAMGSKHLAVTLPRSKELSSCCDRWRSGCELIKVVCCRHVARTITMLAAFR